MYFTDREKGAIIRLIGVMACADGKIAEKEKEMAAAVAITIGENGKGADIAKSMNDTEAMNVIAAMTAEEKRFVCAALGTMMAIDQDINDKEKLVWNLISYRCQFPEMTIIQAIEIFRNYIH